MNQKRNLRGVDVGFLKSVSSGEKKKIKRDDLFTFADLKKIFENTYYEITNSKLDSWKTNDISSAFFNERDKLLGFYTRVCEELEYDNSVFMKYIRSSMESWFNWSEANRLNLFGYVCSDKRFERFCEINKITKDKSNKFSIAGRRETWIK